VHYQELPEFLELLPTPIASLHVVSQTFGKETCNMAKIRELITGNDSAPPSVDESEPSTPSDETSEATPSSTGDITLVLHTPPSPALRELRHLVLDAPNISMIRDKEELELLVEACKARNIELVLPPPAPTLPTTPSKRDGGSERVLPNRSLDAGRGNQKNGSRSPSPSTLASAKRLGSRLVSWVHHSDGRA